MDFFITLILYVLVFALVAVGGFWIIDRGKLPQPWSWVFATALLIGLLIFAARVIKGGFPIIHIT